MGLVVMVILCGVTFCGVLAYHGVHSPAPFIGICLGFGFMTFLTVITTEKRP